MRVTEPIQGNMNPGDESFDSSARSSRERLLVEIDLEAFKENLIVGENVLAIQGHNRSITSGDFLQSPRILEGEFVVQDGPNLVENGDFEQPLNVGSTRQGAWLLEGTHIRSRQTAEEPIEGSRSLLVMASARGDNKVNRLEHTLPALGRATDYIISFKSRWVVGCETIVTQGFDHAFPKSHKLLIPENLGTPGAQNSTYRENTGPIVDNVSQDPQLPGADVPTNIEAKVTDPDGVRSVRLFYWTDRRVTDLVPENLQEIQMTGPDARDRYHATIPGQENLTRIVYFIVAEDEGGLTGRFPVDTPDRSNPLLFDTAQREFLDHRYAVYRHDRAANAGSNLSYRFWLSSRHEDFMARRRLHSNDKVDGAFLFNNSTLYYNAKLRFSGSPFARGGWGESFRVTLPKDRPLHGAIKKFNMEDHQGSGGRDARERISHYLIRHNQGSVRAPYAYQWLVQWQANNRVNELREAVQTPNVDTIERWFPDGDEGDFFEMDDRHTFNDGATRAGSVDGRLTYPPYAAQANTLNLPRSDQELYRWYFNLRMNECKDDYTNLVELARIMTRSETPDEVFDEVIWDVVDVEAFLRVWAIRLNTDDWDTWGARRGKNCYLYRRSDNGLWILLPWDMELTYGNTGAFMPGTIQQQYSNGIIFQEVVRFINRPRIKRMYYGIMNQMINHQFNSRFLAPYRQRLAARSLARTDVMNPNGFIDQRRNRLAQVLRSATATSIDFEISNNSGENFTWPTTALTLTGAASVEVTSIAVLVNDEQQDASATFANENFFDWSVDIVLSKGVNTVSALGFDDNGELIGSDEIQITVEKTPPSLDSVTPDAVLPGDSVVITGSALHEALEVWFGETQATDVDFSGLPESISAVVPEGLAAGPTEVTVGAPGGTRSNAVTIEVLSSGAPFVRGDVDHSGSINVTDAVKILRHLFAGLEIPCEDAADADDTGEINLTDAVYALNYLFTKGPEIPAPFPDSGSDGTDDDLGCVTGVE